MVLEHPFSSSERGGMRVTPTIAILYPEVLMKHLVIQDILDQQTGDLLVIQYFGNSYRIDLWVVIPQTALGPAAAPHQARLRKLTAEVFIM